MKKFILKLLGIEQLINEAIKQERIRMADAIKNIEIIHTDRYVHRNALLPGFDKLVEDLEKSIRG